MKKNHGSEGNPPSQPVGAVTRFLVSRFRGLHCDEGGAILLFSLAGILILMLMTWTVMDAGQVTRTKFEVQASADMAAYSQAAVKARSMNMLAYTNIAKRSVVGIHALYEGMFAAYEQWLFDEYWGQCGSGEPGADSCEALEEEVELWRMESNNDRLRFDRNVDNYYNKDLLALDNYQHYLIELTPWWGWTEAVVRAQRNAATMATSYPPPHGRFRKNFPDISDQVINKVGGSGHHNMANRVERLPVRLVVDDSNNQFNADNMLNYGFRDEAFSRELAANASIHKQDSALGAKLDKNIARGVYMAGNGGQMSSFSDLSQWARPVLFLSADELDTDEKWLKATSNIIITFQDNDEAFGKRRTKFSVPDSEYSKGSIGAADDVFRPKGYWSMARSEISFLPYRDKNGKEVKVPDMWHARWTARMRPMSLPNEFIYGGYNMNGVYYDIMPHLSLSLQIGSRGSPSVDDYFDEMVWMERATRGMGHSTIEGVGK